MNGTLYGTTSGGGTNFGGTVFAFSLQSATESVVYSFCSQQHCTDGESPMDGLTAKRGKLYGTTVGGGSEYYYGTVFEVMP
jgi:uncharacterized repeat protein (TIGR03803 family)